GCRARPAGIADGSTPSTAYTSSPTRTPTAAAAARSRSTAWASKRASYGVRRRSRGSAYSSISGRVISRPLRVNGGEMGSHHAEPEPWVVHRVRALESLLIDQGLLSTEAVD